MLLNPGISRYEGSSEGHNNPMKPWSALETKAFYLNGASPGPDSGEKLFFYDSPPDGKLPPGKVRAPVFVLIHGLGDEADSWRHLIPLLNAGGFRALAVDLPGFGRSVTRKRISMKNHSAAVLKLIETAAPGAEIYLAGNSAGSIVIESLAFKRPDLIKGLVLIDGSIPGGPSSPGFFILLRFLFSRKWYRAYRNVPEAAWASLYPYYADLEAMPPADRSFLKKRVMERVESRKQEDAYFATQRSLVKTYILRSSSFAKKVKNYKGKIILLHGERDRIITLSQAEAFKNLRSDIRLEIIPGAGHLPHQEKPEKTARYMIEFAEF